ncbi:MAG: beta-propeller domain-containing protein, partial [Gammaproteobacteria bacterium]|nr:beta-propeller domain-containing protein [Gammaproteobacteria bacterium]
MFGLLRSLCRVPSSRCLHAVLQGASIFAFALGLAACKNENTAADYSNPALEDYLISSASLTSVPDIYSVDVNAEQSDRFSQTNVQELGVDEADLVKFDGRYLYVVQQPTIDYFTKPPRLPELIDQPLSETLAFDNPLLFDPRAPSLAPRKGAIRVMAPNDTPAAPEVSQIPIDENTQRVQGLYSYSLSDQEHGLALI